MRRNILTGLLAALLLAAPSEVSAEDFLVAGKKFKDGAEAEAYARSLMDQWLLLVNPNVLAAAEIRPIGGSVIALVPSDDFIKKNYLFVAQDKRFLSRRNPTQDQIAAFANSVRENIRVGYRAIERTGYFQSLQVIELPPGGGEADPSIYKADYILYQIADPDVPQGDRGIFSENRKVYTGFQTRTTKFMIRDVKSGRDMNYVTLVGSPYIFKLAPVDVMRLINVQVRRIKQ